MALLDVWEGLELVLVHLRNLLFGQLLLFMCMHGDFEVLGREHLERINEQAELDLELRGSMGLALFCLNALISCPDTVHSSLKN